MVHIWCVALFDPTLPPTPALVAHLRCIHMLMSSLTEFVGFHSVSLLIGSKQVAVC